MTYENIFSFIKKHYPANDAGIIPLHEPVLKGNEKKYLIDCVDSNYVSSVGKFVTQFEENLISITKAKYAIAMANGTLALHIGLIISGVTEDTEVITQPLTFIATCNAISYAGAHPVFVDVDQKTMGMCPNSLKKFLINETEQKNKKIYNKRTGRQITACLPMHVFGHACDIEEIKNICDSYNLCLIEDAAESIGAYYKNRHLGTFGSMGMISFNGNKTITCGGGGALITNDEALAKKARHLSTTARVVEGYEFTHDQVGYNYRLTNLNAAVGCAQLEKLEDFLSIKRQMAENYAVFFRSVNDIHFMKEPEYSKSNYWFNTIRLPTKKERDSFLEMANSHKIQCRPVWKLMTDLPMYKNCQHDGIDNAIELYNCLVNLPSSANAIL